MARHSPVTGRYVTIDVDGLEYKVFYLQNGTGQPLICQHTAGCNLASIDHPIDYAVCLSFCW